MKTLYFTNALADFFHNKKKMIWDFFSFNDVQEFAVKPLDIKKTRSKKLLLNALG